MHHQLSIDFGLAIGTQNLHEVQAGLQGRGIENEFSLALAFGFGADALASTNVVREFSTFTPTAYWVALLRNNRSSSVGVTLPLE